MSDPLLPAGNGALALVPGLAVALGAGLLIGLERERRKARRRGAAAEREPAGIRSFTIAALGGAIAQATGQPLLVAAGAAAVIALAVVAYWASRRGAAPAGRSGGARSPGADDPGLTTELALVVTYLVGVLAMLQPVLGGAVGVVIAALLAARERLHRVATQWLSDAEWHDALLLAALALVLLPLLPAEPVRWLGGLAPRTLMWLLLLILGLQAAGHVALRLAGARVGLALAGLMAGFVSSTAAIASIGSRLRGSPGRDGGARAIDAATVATAATGAVLSSAATWVQALLILGALAPAAAAGVLPLAAAAIAATALIAAAAWRRGHAGGPSTASADSPARSGPASAGPLRLREAAWLAGLLAAVSVAVAYAQRELGTLGVLGGSALAGLADAHAPIAAAGALGAAGTIDTALVRDVVLVAIGANSASRAVVAFAAGGRRYGAWVLAALAAAFTAALGADLLLREAR